MQFDEAKYKTFLQGHRKAGTYPEDLLERYQITLPAHDAEIAAQVVAVRKCWNKLSAQAGTKDRAEWCRKRDEELRKQADVNLESAVWWMKVQQEGTQKAEADIQALADALRQAYGALEVVTAVALGKDGAQFKLSAAQAQVAAGRAGLTVIDENVTLPDDPLPLAPSVLTSLTRNLEGCQVTTVPELLHPGSGPFRIVRRYECLRDRNLELDLNAILTQLGEAQKKKDGTSTDKAKALGTLRDAVQGRNSDLRVITLQHLMSLIPDGTQAFFAKQILERRGVDAQDAAIIALLLAGRAKATRESDADKVRGLLEKGELREAANLAGTLSGEEGTAVQQLVAARQQELKDRLDQAAAAQQAGDEALAQEHLRAADLISHEDTAPRLAQLPLAPAVNLRGAGDDEQVKLFWDAGPGHDGSTRYAVTRKTGGTPTAPGDGTRVHEGPETECADPEAPVATEVQYAVFALADGRPASRAVTTAVTALPTVRDLKADTGVGTVTLTWQAHVMAEVQITRTAPGAEPVPVGVTGNSVQLKGLPEGVPQLFEVTAVYRGSLTSKSRQVTAVPRGEAKPNKTLRVTTAQGVGSRVRARASWDQIGTSEVRLLRTDAPLAWPEGATITPEQADQAGEVVTGHVVVDGKACSMEFELLGGIHYLTALSEGGTGVAVGVTRLIAAIAPVTELAATPFTDYATISWSWPPGIELAEASWQIGDDDQTADYIRVSRAEYRAKGGVRVPLGGQPCAVEVRALIMVDGKPRPSAPASLTVERVLKVPIRYRVSGAPFSRAKKVTFTADEACGGTLVRMIAVHSQPSIMPTKPGDGTVVLEATLNLAPGVAVEHKVEIPKLKKPYWVRCFLISGPGRLVDPPIAELKEG